jgi:16S rRNA U1498 N3-methylase RsmE
MPRHTLLFEPDDLSDDRLVVAGPEAEHAAKSKRLRAGDELTAIDGDGLRLTCRVALVTKRSLELEVIERETIAQTSPAVHLGSATPKAQRLDKMIDMVSQAGAASWTPVETRLGVVDPGATKLDRMRRIVAESAKQCGRAHLMRLRAKTPLGRFLAAGEGRTLVVADGSGGAYRPTGGGGHPRRRRPGGRAGPGRDRRRPRRGRADRVARPARDADRDRLRRRRRPRAGRGAGPRPPAT